MSCISPIAPLRETALGLKLDSTFTRARTRLGSTLCRAAALSIAALTSSWLNPAAGKEFWLEGDFPRYWSTSAAADWAAFTFACGTAFQRRSVVLQNAR